MTLAQFVNIQGEYSFFLDPKKWQIRWTTEKDFDWQVSLRLQALRATTHEWIDKHLHGEVERQITYEKWRSKIVIPEGMVEAMKRWDNECKLRLFFGDQIPKKT